ncbi:antibiotic biosynthesis monooxygenase [Agarivorans sp. TSD2052]|nr:antibiotic biosynthesis monooxygenase [Agarivorans sp. TSD2052]UPW18654.1 antibiotic biosynthesis monooxygenase [Agarivorans sp. TSD2052]
MPKMLENAQASLAQEEGCLQFDVCLSTEQDNIVYLYEVYHSKILTWI